MFEVIALLSNKKFHKKLVCMFLIQMRDSHVSSILRKSILYVFERKKN